MWFAQPLRRLLKRYMRRSPAADQRGSPAAEAPQHAHRPSPGDAPMMKFLNRSGTGRAAADRVMELEAKVAAISRSQAVIEFKLDGTIITANQNFLGALGYREE